MNEFVLKKQKIIAICIIVVITSLFKISYTAPDEQQVKKLYSKGMELLNSGHLDSAQVTFQTLIQQDKKNHLGYYGMGLVALELSDNKKAQKYFERSIRFNRKFAEAYLQLGKIYGQKKNQLFKARENMQKAVRYNPKLSEGWILLAEYQLALGQYTEVLKAYGQLVVLAPDNHRTMSEFITFACQNEKEKYALKLIGKLKRQNPNSAILLLFEARLLHRLGEYEESLKTIEKINTQQHKTMLSLLTAKNYFGMKNNVAGVQNYWESIKSAVNSTDARLLLADICFIIKDDEYDELKVTSVDSLLKFYQSFWRSRDPNLATLENERLTEHYHRLLTTFKTHTKLIKVPQHRHKNSTWRINDIKDVLSLDTSGLNPVGYRPGETGFLNPLLLDTVRKLYDNFFHQMYIGEELYKLLRFPKALVLNEYIDDMGVVLIRHGEPDKWIKSSGKMVLSPNATFKYYSKPNQPEMHFHFIKTGMSGWIFSSLPLYFEDREFIDSKYYTQAKILTDIRQVNFSLNVQGESVLNVLLSDQSELKDISEETVEHISNCLNTEHSSYKFTEESTNVPHQILTFKGKTDKTNLELYYLINGNETILKNDCLDLEKFLGFYDQGWQERFRMVDNEKIELKQTPDDWDKNVLIKKETATLTPGKYTYEFHIKDNVANKIGAYRSEIVLPDYHQKNQLTLSDVILSGYIGEEQLNSTFKKENISYSPHMFTRFQKMEKIGIYFEIYNLTLDENELTHFKISYQLKNSADNTSTFGKVVGFFKSLVKPGSDFVSIDSDYQGTVMDEKIYMNFDIGGKEAGDYILSIEITDLISQQKDEKMVSISIQ